MKGVLMRFFISWRAEDIDSHWYGWELVDDPAEWVQLVCIDASPNAGRKYVPLCVLPIPEEGIKLEYFVPVFNYDAESSEAMPTSNSTVAQDEIKDEIKALKRHYESVINSKEQTLTMFKEQHNADTLILKGANSNASAENTLLREEIKRLKEFLNDEICRVALQMLVHSSGLGFTKSGCEAAFTNAQVFLDVKKEYKDRSQQNKNNQECRKCSRNSHKVVGSRRKTKLAGF
jgi:hypothetical protein